MKKLKKLALGLLTLVLSFCFINNVYAFNKGSIIVNGTNVDKTYEIYKIFDLTYSGSNVAYTIDSDWENFFLNDGSKYIVSTNTGSLNAITVGNITKYINITDDNVEEFTQEALIYAASLNGNDGSKEAAGETLTFDSLSLGYYLVYPVGATDIISGNGSICSLTSTLPQATVNIKADYPIIEKSVDKQSADVGQLVQFKITGLVPDTTGYKSYIYEINDTMSSGLELDSVVAEFTVKFGTTIIDKEPVYGENSFTLTFDMTDYQDYVGETISITYKVRVTNEAINSDTTKNSVTLTYSNNPKENTTYTTIPVEIPVSSSGIKVIKVDATDNDIKLDGASFVIKDSAGNYYQALDSDGKVVTNTTSTENVTLVKWDKDIEKATVLVTDEAGIITFSGIENETYYLVEVEAPQGYNKLTGPVEVKVGYNDDGTNLETTPVIHEKIIENNSGTALPSTGGVGTKIFIIVGSLLVVGSSVILITNKRIMKENK